MNRFRRFAHLLVAAAGIVPIVASAAPAAPAITLPPPSREPQRIDFANDPLIGFVRAPTRPEPFLDAVATAVKDYPAVGEAIAVQAETRGVRAEVRAGLFPQVDARLIDARSLSRNFGDRTAIIESLSPRERADASVTGEQLIYDFGATGNRISAANDRTRAAAAEVSRVAADTALRAVTAWYDVLTFQTLVELSAATIARHETILGDTRERLRQGVGASGDVVRAEASLADAQGVEVRFERQLADARGRFRELFGVDPPPRLSRPAPPASTATSFELAEAMSRSAPQVSAAEARAAAAGRDWKAAKADGLPRLSTAITATRYDVFANSSDHEVRAIFQLRQSLTAGGAYRARADQAHERLQQAEFAVDRARAQSERDAGTAWREIELLDRATATLETAYVANRRTRDLDAEQFRVSRGTLIDVLRAEQDYFAAATTYLQGAIALDLARYTLLARTAEILPAFGVTLSVGSL